MPPVPNPILMEIRATPDNLAELADKLKPADVAECEAMGWKPRDALWFALADCPEGTIAVGSWARGGHEPVIVGAYGWNHRGNIWSLWAPLNIREAKCMLQNSNATIQSVLQRANKPMLWNYVSLENHSALRWMALCPSIQIDRMQVKRYGDLTFAPFMATRQVACAPQ